jgi:hypothetical protein
MAKHLAEPFPSMVVKGLDYGNVDAVMIGADIYGWSTRVDSVEKPLTEDEWTRFELAASDLAKSIPEFPHAARPYYELILRMARAALSRRHR